MYYPKSQIKTNLYTNGGEYVIKTSGKDYIGFYYKLSNGELYVGKQPSGRGNTQLITPPNSTVSPEDYKENDVRIALFVDDPDPTIEEELNGQDILLYTDSLGDNTVNVKARLLPPPYYSTPTQKEKIIGEYRRYFAKKTNELIYIEISKETYTKFKSNDPTVASDLYECLFFPWSIRTPNSINSNSPTPETINRKIVAQVERNNKWYGFTSYFRGNFG